MQAAPHRGWQWTALGEGVAGIGKTRLVQAAVTEATPSVTVMWAACLPLATAVPLLPLVDVLRSVHEVDEGQWLKEALAERPPYVTRSLARLLPELASARGRTDDPDGTPAPATGCPRR